MRTKGKKGEVSGASMGTADSKRMTIRMPSATHERTMYWAEHHKHGAISANEYVNLAVEEKIARDCGQIPDYDDVIIGRLNQLIEVTTENSYRLDALFEMMNHTMQTFITLAHGDNTLLLDEDDPAASEARGEEL